eukprot:119515-Rhodomonas_salina.3
MDRTLLLPILLRACYAMSGTDLTYGAATRRVTSPTKSLLRSQPPQVLIRTSRRVYNAMAGTDMTSGATCLRACYARPGTDLADEGSAPLFEALLHCPRYKSTLKTTTFPHTLYQECGYWYWYLISQYSALPYVRYWHSVFRAAYAMSGTEICCAATRLRVLRVPCNKIGPEGSYPLSCYALDMRCPVLAYRRVLAASALATPCPVLTSVCAYQVLPALPLP